MSQLGSTDEGKDRSRATIALHLKETGSSGKK